MKLPALPRVLREDIDDAPAWVEKLIGPINTIAEAVYQGFNKSLTFDENLACFTKELVYKTPSTYPTTETVTFTNDLKIKATGVQILQAVEKATYLGVAATGIAWVENNGKILISTITGLQADKVYLIRLLIS